MKLLLPILPLTPPPSYPSSLLPSSLLPILPLTHPFSYPSSLLPLPLTPHSYPSSPLSQPMLQLSHNFFGAIPTCNHTGLWSQVLQLGVQWRLSQLFWTLLHLWQKSKQFCGVSAMQWRYCFVTLHFVEHRCQILFF